MTYIAHRRYRGKTAAGITVNFPRGTEFEAIGPWIARDGKAVCAIHSDTAQKYFARNDDGCGLLRGQYTRKIAWEPRDRGGFRFTEDERDLLATKWAKFLRPEHEFIIFNDDFFAAEIMDLRQMAYDLKLEVKENA